MNPYLIPTADYFTTSLFHRQHYIFLWFCQICATQILQIVFLQVIFQKIIGHFVAFLTFPVIFSLFMSKFFPFSFCFSDNFFHTSFTFSIIIHLLP